MSAAAKFHPFPLSPFTPSEPEVDHRPQATIPHAAPRSPVSPSLMSVATKSYVSSYGNNQHTDEMAQRPSPRPTADSYMHNNQKMNSYQEGSLKRLSQDDDEQHRDKRQKLDISQSDRMQIDSHIQPTNHERSRPESDKEIEVEKSGIEEIEKSVQSSTDGFDQPFLLCKSSVPRSNPDPQRHLLGMYGLLPLLKTVARNDPESGEKINKLRKSYEGQIKTFGLSGRNKPVKCDREEDEPGPLRILATLPEHEWNEKGGKGTIEVTSEFRSKLEKALQLQPGTVRNNAMWEDLLGHEKPKPGGAPIPTQPQQFSRTPNGLSRLQQSSSTTNTDKRSTRGKKRSYGDDSFVGYGEGFSEGDDDGGEDDLSKRKRKKDSFGSSSSFHQYGR